MLALRSSHSCPRIPSLEALRYVAPEEWSKLIGLDRISEVRTLRQKLGELCSDVF
jgi:hypothetical protein